MIVGKGETILKGLGKCIIRMGSKGRQAFAHVTRRGNASLLAQLARGATVISHGHHGAHLVIQAQQAANRHGGSGAATDNHHAFLGVFRFPVLLSQGLELGC